MTYERFIERIGWGEEFPFTYKGEQYWISQNKEGNYLTRVRDSYAQSFKNAEELLINGRLDGKSLVDLWDQIQDQF